MKKLFFVFSMIISLAFVFYACEKASMKENAPAQENKDLKSQGCTTIQNGGLVDSKGLPIETGYDQWGYNYQAHMFNGFGCNYSRPAVPCESGDGLIMKWNDAWPSNTDCDGDGKLDRHYGFLTYIGSGAWLTNHWNGTYELEDGTVCHWTEFTKIVAVPEGAYLDEPTYTDPWGDTHQTWYTAADEVIGYEIWGEFAIIEDIINDPCAGYNGVEYKSPDHAGLGNW
jgi:hypothetical protein